MKIGQNHKFKALSYCDFLTKLILGRLSAGRVHCTVGMLPYRMPCSLHAVQFTVHSNQLKPG